MRFKKHIIIICLFTFLFFPISGKYQEPKAFDLVVTPSVITLCAAFALTTGVVIANQDQFIEVGHRVFEGIKEIPNAIEKVGNKIKINALKSVIDTVYNICNALPVGEIFSNYIFKKSVSSSSGCTKTCYITEVPNIGGDFYLDYSLKCSLYTPTSIKVGFSGFGSTSSERINLPFLQGDKFNVRVYFKNTHIFNNGYLEYIPTLTINSTTYNFPTLSVRGNTATPYISFNEDVYYLDGVANNSVCVDMKGVKDNVSIDKPLTYFPEIDKGSISVDDNLVSYPSIDKPISVPTDLPNVSVDSGVIDKPGDGAIDKPGDGAIDKPGDGAIDTPSEGILSNILDFLKSIFISDNIKDIDFSPLYFSVSEKFPFSIPFDLINLIKEFEAEKKEPKFFIDMSSFSSNKYSRGEVGFWLDFTEFDEIIEILRTLILIIFMFFIALKTRDIIKG